MHDHVMYYRNRHTQSELSPQVHLPTEQKVRYSFQLPCLKFLSITILMVVTKKVFFQSYRLSSCIEFSSRIRHSIKRNYLHGHATFHILRHVTSIFVLLKTTSRSWITSVPIDMLSFYSDEQYVAALEAADWTVRLSGSLKEATVISFMLY